MLPAEQHACANQIAPPGLQPPQQRLGVETGEALVDRHAEGGPHRLHVVERRRHPVAARHDEGGPGLRQGGAQAVEGGRLAGEPTHGQLGIGGQLRLHLCRHGDVHLPGHRVVRRAPQHHLAGRGDRSGPVGEQRLDVPGESGLAQVEPPDEVPAVERELHPPRDLDRTADDEDEARDPPGAGAEHADTHLEVLAPSVGEVAHHPVGSQVGAVSQHDRPGSGGQQSSDRLRGVRADGPVGHRHRVVVGEEDAVPHVGVRPVARGGPAAGASSFC